MLLDGKAHSAQWRENEAAREAAKALKAARAAAEAEFLSRYGDQTEYAASLMIPVDQLPRDFSSSQDPGDGRTNGAADDRTWRS